MFTPPPSPRPRHLRDELQNTTEDMPPSLSPKNVSLPGPGPSSHEQKLAIGRRTGWVVLLVPLVVFLTTVSTRFVLHPVAFDVFSSPPSWTTLVTKGMNWTPHKRHPLPYPQGPSSNLTTSSNTATPTTTSQPVPTIPSSPPTLPTPFPQPFDSGLAQNFSSVSCYNFFANMTAALDFRACRSFSLLLSSSADFIDVSVKFNSFAFVHVPTLLGPT
jgi:hypothetical protein